MRGQNLPIKKTDFSHIALCEKALKLLSHSSQHWIGCHDPLLLQEKYLSLVTAVATWKWLTCAKSAIGRIILWCELYFRFGLPSNYTELAGGNGAVSALHYTPSAD
jgi:hypothetical protein